MGFGAKNQGGWSNSQGKNCRAGPLCLLSCWVVPSIWQSFIQIGEMACITPAWSSGKLGLKLSGQFYTYIYTQMLHSWHFSWQFCCSLQAFSSFDTLLKHLPSSPSTVQILGPLPFMEPVERVKLHRCLSCIIFRRAVTFSWSV